MSLSNKSNTRGGFTLVELLVVITIIGILVSLLVPTLAAALKRSREGAIAIEIKQLEAAFESMRKERVKKSNLYPPDFSRIDPSALTANTPAMNNQRAGELQAYLRAMSRNANRSYAVRWMQNKVTDNNGNDVDVFQGPIIGNTTNTSAPTPVDLDPAEALVFWLGMTQKNPEAPLPSRYSRPAGPGFAPPSGEGTWTFFEFDDGRIVDQDNDGWPEYLQAHGEETPYVYFRDPSSVYDGRSNGRQQGFARPYQVTQAKFQIIAAGYDGVYSAYGSPPDPSAAITAAVFNSANVRSYPAGDNFTEFDLDNISNFSEGRVDNKLD